MKKPFFQVWWEAVLRPASFDSLLNDPQVSITRALLWVAAATGISTALQVSLGALFQAALGTDSSFYTLFNFLFDEVSEGQTFLLGLFCAVPVGMLLAVVVVLIGGGILHGISRLFGGDGTLEDLIYLMAAYTAPISLINGVFAPLPYIGLLSFLITLYSFGLQVMAVKTVHHLGWPQAIFAVVVPMAGLVGCCGITVLVLAFT
ncbi:MAG: YIP1 family protein [Anaerolineae bacterium]|nr:YIP1 family protein [Anaerolineae bacterium]